jgi:hypothetical protein
MRNWFVYIASDGRLREQAETNGRITDVLPSGTTADAQVSIISWSGASIDALAVMRAGARVANYKTRVSITDVYKLDAPLKLGRVVAEINEPLRAAIELALTSGGRLSPDVSKVVRDVLLRLRPELEDVVERLEHLAHLGREPLWEDDSEPIVAYERDAVGLALSFAGIDRVEILRKWVDNPRVPFLDGLNEYRVSEDAIVTHDSQVFGSWDTLGPSLTGITVFRDGNRELTVVNANRQPIEHTLGVDLLYYANEFDSYVLVQYKRLRQRGRDWEFRPSSDRNFDPELARMRSIVQSADNGLPGHHRLGENFCFIKFCKPTTRHALVPNGELSSGMYLPLDYFDKLAVAGHLTGPRGGAVVSFDNVGRWLNNSAFVALVERAWVGTRALTSAQITEIIEQSLAGDRSIVIAAGRVIRSRRH